MLAEIITIGDEILIGQIVDTNSAYISKELNKIGIKVFQITSIQDDRDHILAALADAAKRVQLVIVTGQDGLSRQFDPCHSGTKFFIRGSFLYEYSFDCLKA